MESMSPPPAKRRRSGLKTIRDLQIVECRREFNLPQQYPSMVGSFKKYQNTFKTTSASNVAIPKTVKLVSSNEEQATGKIKKLRIKLQDGRDLGEIKVQFLSNKDSMLNGKALTITKSNLLNNLNKSVTLSVLPSEGTDDLLNILPVQQKNPEGSKPVVSSTSAAQNETSRVYDIQQAESDTNLKLVHKPLILARKSGSDKTEVHENGAKNSDNQDSIAKNKKVSVTSESSCKELHNGNSNYGHVTKYVKILPKTGENVKKTQPASPRPSPRQILEKTVQHLELAKSKYPVVKCEKLELSNSFTIVKNKHFLKPQITTLLTNKESCRTNVIPRETNFWGNRIVGKQRNGTQSCQQSKSKLGKDIMVAVHNEKTATANKYSINTKEQDSTAVSAKSKVVNRNVNNRPTSTLNDRTYVTVNRQKKDSNSGTGSSDNISSTTTESHTNSAEQERLSQHWNIIQKAVSSVKDERLRAEALKALADCGIGLERHVPIQPPTELKAIHDSQSQTEVFGLLDSQSFVLVRDDLPYLERIKQTEQLFNSQSSSLAANSSMLLQTKNNQNMFLDNSNMFLGPTLPSPVTDPFDFDSFFDDLCIENKGAKKVKEVFSKPSPVCNKICTQLQKDFEGAKEYDSDGMLNIHRAVLSNNVCNVQRILLVFKACKQYIDVPTLDGVTSLELAIKTNASTEIVKLLLQAGAQPATSTLAHDSALILASKQSSPVLPELVTYVTDRKLLNQIDSNGFAALHYCALNGNLDGVQILIQAGAKVNLKDNRSGRTPIFHALECNHAVVAQKLLDAGAIPQIPNFAGQTIISLMDDVKNLSLRTALNKVVK